MSDDEPIDQITATGAYINSEPRSTIHADGKWHQVFHCLIVRTPEPTTVVLQRRSAHARSFPNKLDLSATGHLLAGEQPLDGVREVEEELGIEVDVSALTSVGTRLLADDSGEGRNRERVNLFFLTDDRPLNDFSPDETEVQSLIELSVEELLSVLNEPGYEATALEWRPNRDLVEVLITKDQLVTPVDGYWNVLLVMAERFNKGLRPIAI